MHQRNRIYTHAFSWLECSSLIQHATVSCCLFLFISNKHYLEVVDTEHADPIKSVTTFIYLKFQPDMASNSFTKRLPFTEGFFILAVEPWSAELSDHKVDKWGTELAFDKVPHLAFQALKQSMIIVVMKLWPILVGLGHLLNATIYIIY